MATTLLWYFRMYIIVKALCYKPETDKICKHHFNKKLKNKNSAEMKK